MASQFTIVGLGEALFDIFSDKQVLGGAPLNAAVHAHQLGSVRGGRGLVVSRVGQDELGTRVRQELTERGMNTGAIQTDPDHATGRVYVRLNDEGQPDYEIVANAAWDWFQWDPDLDDVARQCEAVCFSSLSQRHNQARGGIQRFLTEARQAIRLFDLTLRQSFYDQRTLRRSCELSTVVKLNLEELKILCQQLGLDGEGIDGRVNSILRSFELQMVVVTRGQEGTVLYTSGDRFEGAAASFDPVEGADSVGAGDGCTAAILVGLLLRLPMREIADLANQVGAYIASVPGATPALAESILQRLQAG